MISTDWIVVICLFIFFFIIAGAGAFIALYRVRWPWKWEKYEDVNGQTIRTAKGRMRLIPFGDGGEEVFFLKNIKKYKVAYGKRIGQKLVAWFVPQNGYWYNATFGNIDKKLMEIGVFPVDRDMRMANSMVRKGIDTRYYKQTFMDKYGVMISFGLLFFCIIAMCGFLWIGFNGQKQVANINAKVMTDAVPKVLDKLDSILTRANGGTVPGGQGYVITGTGTAGGTTT